MAKTFILGIGAQRTGSTWLYSQLRKNPSIDLGFCKEYHVFDSLFTPFAPKPNGLFGVKKRSLESLRKELTRRSFIKNPERYFDYFDRLQRQKKTTKAVGDITPSYSMLDSSAFQFIRDGLERKGFRVKVIFSMRDPVERSWSMFHQASRVRRAIKKNEPRPVDLSIFTDPRARMRSQYDRTINELEKVFPEKDIFYGFYETLFQTESYEKLGQFLGINLREPNFQLVRNPSIMKSSVGEDLAKQAAQYYAPIYNYIHQRFGAKMIDLWDGYRHLES